MHQTRALGTREAIEQMASLLGRVSPTEWEHLPEADLVELLMSARRFADRVTGLTASLVRVVDRRNAAGIAKGMPLHALITLEEHRDGRDTTRALAEGRDIARNPQVAGGVLDGTLTPDHAAKVVKAIDDLPRGLNREQAERITGILIGEAAHCRPSDLPGKAEAALRQVAPEHAPSREDEERKVAWQRREALRRRSLRFGDDGEGSFWFKGSLPYLEAQPLISSLERLVAGQKRAEHDGTRRHGIAPTHEQRYADALTDLARAASSSLPSGGGGAGTGSSAAPTGPAVPSRPAAPGVPAIPAGPTISAVPAAPGVPAIPAVPAGPGVPAIPALPAAPGVPAIPAGPAIPSARVIPVLPAIPSATVVVTISEADLTQRATAAGLLGSGHRIPAGDLRRLLCDAPHHPGRPRLALRDPGHGPRHEVRHRRPAESAGDAGWRLHVPGLRGE
ncbi:MAG: DUF222 domain-containing protein [Arachnia sp.]